MARASTRPAPSELMMTILPSRTACRRPAAPSRDAALSSSGSAKSASMRRSSTSVRRSPETVRMKTPSSCDDQILAFDQQKAEIAGEISVLEIGFVHRPGRQQADAGVVAAVEREQFGLQRLKERRHALDARGAIDVGNGARQREPVLDRVAGAGRRLRAIAEHPPASVGAAADIDRIEAQMRAAGRRDADQRPQEFRIAGDQGRRQPAVARQRAGPVGIRQHRFEQFGALDQAGFQLPPFAGFDDAAGYGSAATAARCRRRPHRRDRTRRNRADSGRRRRSGD